MRLVLQTELEDIFDRGIGFIGSIDQKVIAISQNGGHVYEIEEGKKSKHFRVRAPVFAFATSVNGNYYVCHKEGDSCLISTVNGKRIRHFQQLNFEPAAMVEYKNGLLVYGDDSSKHYSYTKRESFKVLIPKKNAPAIVKPYMAVHEGILYMALGHHVIAYKETPKGAFEEQWRREVERDSTGGIRGLCVDKNGGLYVLFKNTSQSTIHRFKGGQDKGIHREFNHQIYEGLAIVDDAKTGKEMLYTTRDKSLVPIMAVWH